jgi:hypothetical protein
MAQNINPSSAQTMVKSGDQPRATEKSVSETRSPASISYVRYGINKNPSARTGSMRSSTRG